MPEPRGPSSSGAAAPSAYPAPVDRLIGELARLPGIGRRSAERLALHLLKSESGTALALAAAITEVKQRIRNCAICSNLTDQSVCAICADPARDHATLLVVEQPRDLLAFEATGMYRGVYHVLLGHLAPLEGIDASALTIADLLDRIDHPAKNAPASLGPIPVREIVLGLSPTMEGDGTALYLAGQLKSRDVRTTRLARGIPTGSSLEFANKAVLADAITGRRSME